MLGMYMYDVVKFDGGEIKNVAVEQLLANNTVKTPYFGSFAHAHKDNPTNTIMA